MFAVDTFFQHLFDFVVGAFGASVRVAIGHERGEKQNVSRIYITIISGTVLAGTTGGAMASYIGVPDSFSGAICFLVGLLGVGFVYQLYDGKITIPFFKPAATQQEEKKL